MRSSAPLLLAIAAIALAPEAAAQTMIEPEGAVDTMEHLFGATPLVAQAGNGRLSAGYTGDGDLAVLRWPSATYWDHLNYKTANGAEARDRPRMGAAPHHGGFWGIWTEEQGVTWLHDSGWTHEVRYAGDSSVQVVTVASHAGLGVTVTLTDGVLHDDDVLIRMAAVQDAPEGAKLLHHLSVAPHTDHKPFVPLYEVEDSRRASVVSWDAASDTGTVTLPEGAAGVGMTLSAFPAPDQWQCGGPDALSDAEDGDLAKEATFSGTASLVLRWDADKLATLAIRLADTAPEAFDPITAADRLVATDDHWEGRVAAMKLPATDDPELLAFSKRTLIAILQGTDAATGAIVASVAQQPPYHLDWPRDGAFFNVALQLAGLTDLVDQRNGFYAQVQRTEDGQDRFLTTSQAPPGSWAMNYYADGTPGGPIDFEIDEVGFTAWSLAWLGGEGRAADHKTAIERAAEVLATCRDEEEPRLQCLANEDDNPELTRTLHGAETVLLGLRAAQQAGFGDHGARIAELEQAIEEVFYDAEAGHFPNDGIGQNSWAIWPVQLWHHEDLRWDGVADRLLAHLRERLLEPRPEGSSYDAKATLALAHLWRDPEQPGRDDLRKAIRILATEVAMPGTHHLGEVYLPNPDDDGDGRPDGWSNRTSPPHLWEATLVYLSLMAFYEPGILDGLAPDPPAPRLRPAEPSDDGGLCAQSIGGSARRILGLLPRR